MQHKMLQQLLSALPFSYQIFGKSEQELSMLCMDSRKVQAQSLFAALPGTKSNGQDFIEEAIQRGACCILCEELPQELQKQVCYIQVPNAARALGFLASAFYAHPSKDMQVVGVTGTNGKTSIATLLFRLFTQLGYHCGLVSTIEYRIGKTSYQSTHTTPSSLHLQELLAQMCSEGCTYVFMEVSSHASVQERIAGVEFKGALFSNISHEHLDYHGSFQEYIKAKKYFFDQIPASAFALVNADDKRGLVMLQNTEAKKYSYSLRQLADFRCRIVENSLRGLLLDIDGQHCYTPLVGRFNAYNFLAVYAAACLLGQEAEEVLRLLSGIGPAEGRFDALYQEQLGILAIIDFAHSPDALAQVLETIGQMPEAQEGRIITVVGCGGDRDKTKRPLMAQTAYELSQQLIISSDNPRTEEPQAIIQDMLQGLSPEAQVQSLQIANRRQAIRTACQLAQKGDIILIAGKGHEKYQEIQGVKHPFDDKEEVLAAFAARLAQVKKKMI